MNDRRDTYSWESVSCRDIFSFIFVFFFLVFLPTCDTFFSSSFFCHFSDVRFSLPFRLLLLFLLLPLPSVSPPSPLRHSCINCCYLSYYWLLSPLLCPCFIHFLRPLFPFHLHFASPSSLKLSLPFFSFNFLLLLRFPLCSLLSF